MSRASRSTSTIVRLSLVLLAAPAPLAAQAVHTGRTLSDSTKDPLAGVEVVLERPASRVATAAEGRFSLGRIPWGVQTVIVRKIGYRPVHLRLTVAGDDTVEVDIPMKAAAVELEPIEVTASTGRRGMEDFARRRLAGSGRFFDAKDLRRAEHRRLGDFLAGVRGVRVLGGGTRAVLVSSRNNCLMAVWLDGVPLTGAGSRRSPQDINEFSLSQLDGIEVYAGAAETPVELTGVGGSSCGTVVLWTRRGG
jgi:hypothetical protein